MLELIDYLFFILIEDVLHILRLAFWPLECWAGCYWSLMLSFFIINRLFRGRSVMVLIKIIYFAILKVKSHKLN
jgi:hypothetical protein